MRASQVKYFDPSFTATVNNNSSKVKGKQWGSPTLLGLLEVRDISAARVSMKFSDSSTLLLSYVDRDTIRTKELKGKFARKGYYEIFLSNESKGFPPGFSFIFGRHHINRIRMALSVKEELIVDNRWDESGNILFLGVGDKGRRQSFFVLAP